MFVYLFSLFLAFNNVLSSEIISSISSHDFTPEHVYEFEPSVNKISLEFKFDNLLQCMSDFGSSCVCYETSLIPYKSTSCPPNMALFCFNWVVPFGSFLCPSIQRGGFESAPLGTDPAKQQEIEEANDYKNSQQILICIMEDVPKTHFYFWEKFVVSFDVQNMKIQSGDRAFILGAGSSHKKSNEGINMFRFGFVHTTNSCSFQVTLTNTDITSYPPTPEVPTEPTPLQSSSEDPVVHPSESNPPAIDDAEDSKSSTSPEVAQAALAKYYWILIIFAVMILIATCVYVYVIRLAVKRKGCFTNLDVKPSRQVAGTDKLPKKIKDPSVDQSIQMRTAAHDYDNFGNLTTEDTKTNVTNEDKGKKRTISKQATPPPLPPATAAVGIKNEQPIKPPSVAKSFTGATGKTTKKSHESGGSSDDKNKQDKPKEAPAPVRPKSPTATPPENGPTALPYTSGEFTPQPNQQQPPSTSNVQSEPQEREPAKPIVQPPSAVVEPEPQSATSKDKIQSADKLKTRSTQQEPGCCVMLFSGTLKKERPGLYRVILASSIIYWVFLISVIGIACLIFFLLP